MTRWSRRRRGCTSMKRHVGRTRDGFVHALGVRRKTARTYIENNANNNTYASANLTPRLRKACRPERSDVAGLRPRPEARVEPELEGELVVDARAAEKEDDVVAPPLLRDELDERGAFSLWQLRCVMTWLTRMASAFRRARAPRAARSRPARRGCTPRTPCSSRAPCRPRSPCS